MRILSFLKDVHRIRQGKVVRPRFLTYVVTFACNARCVMCDSWRKRPDDEMTIAEIEGVFQKLPRMDAIRLTGGEPFVRPDLDFIASLATRILQPSFLHITTNGFLTERIVSFCEKRDPSTPLRLLVSLDGLPKQHNRIRGREDAWDATMATLRELAGRQKELRLTLTVNQTLVDPQGVKDAVYLRELLHEMGVKHQGVLAYAASATYATRKEAVMAPTAPGQFAPFGEFTKGQLRQWLDWAEHHLSDFSWAERAARRYYLSGVRARILENRGAPAPGCVALNAHLRLYPNGDVPVCQFNSRRVGNLRTQSLEQVWFGEDIHAHRRWVSDCPGCWAECEVIPNAIYTGDLLFPGKRPVRPPHDDVLPRRPALGHTPSDPGASQAELAPSAAVNTRDAL